MAYSAYISLLRTVNVIYCNHLNDILFDRQIWLEYLSRCSVLVANDSHLCHLGIAGGYKESKNGPSLQTAGRDVT